MLFDRMKAMADKSEPKLEIVVKCDLDGSMDAVRRGLSTIEIPAVRMELIGSGIGPISKSDLMMATTGSKLVIGFNVGLMPKLESFVRENGIEVRLYRVIYRLLEDVHNLAESLIVHEPVERITGRAEIIAVFKAGRKDMIVGCEVLEGRLKVGDSFQVISAMGPIYTGTIQSMEIEKAAVRQAAVGRQVGIKIPGFTQAKVNDLLECREIVRPKETSAWRPRGEIIHVAD